jgi:hypothetical protein
MPASLNLAIGELILDHFDRRRANPSFSLSRKQKPRLESRGFLSTVPTFTHQRS